MPDPRDILLAVAFRHSVTEATIEAGLERVQALAGADLTAAALHDALDACQREGLIHDPVRLSAGALHCHWRLELTPAGVAAARAIRPPACP